MGRPSRLEINTYLKAQIGYFRELDRCWLEAFSWSLPYQNTDKFSRKTWEQEIHRLNWLFPDQWVKRGIEKLTENENKLIQDEHAMRVRILTERRKFVPPEDTVTIPLFQLLLQKRIDCLSFVTLEEFVFWHLENLKDQKLKIPKMGGKSYYKDLNARMQHELARIHSLEENWSKLMKEEEQKRNHMEQKYQEKRSQSISRFNAVQEWFRAFRQDVIDTGNAWVNAFAEQLDQEMKNSLDKFHRSYPNYVTTDYINTLLKLRPRGQSGVGAGIPAAQQHMSFRSRRPAARPVEEPTGAYGASRPKYD